MSTHRHLTNGSASLETLFHDLSPLSPLRRRQAIDALTPAQRQSVPELESLLAAHDQASSRDAETSPSSEGGGEKSSGGDGPRPATRNASLAIGTQVGGFEIVRAIGGGSAAEVFEARRIGPASKPVALKILRPGMGSVDLRARIEEERERLAQFDHPGIASLVDAGATPDGRPWFAMHFVDGAPITRYCDDRTLSVSSRVDLLRQVCEALAYAHRRNVVHRDVTPSNIVVTEIDGRPRAVVVDFGIAKALNLSGRVNSELPVHRKILGTPSYMAPEQTTPGGPLGTPADVFGVGSLMTELLAGSTPLDIESLDTPSLDVVFADVRSRERPSLAAVLRRQPQDVREEIARRRGTTPPKLARLLEGELQWIAAHCLELNPDLRYGSAEALGKDLDRWLHGEPLEVGPRKVLTRIRSFVRHHRVAVGVSLFVLVTLIVTTIVSAHFVLSENAARQLANARDTAARLMMEFPAAILQSVDPQAEGRALVARLTLKYEESLRAKGVPEAEIDRATNEFAAALAATNPADAARELVTRTILSTARTKIDQRFADHPLIAARLLGSVASVYAELGMIEEVKALQSQVLRVLELELGPNSPATITAAVGLGGALIHQGGPEAESVLARAARTLRTDPSVDPVLVVGAMRLHARALFLQERFIEAETGGSEALAIALSNLGTDHDETIQCRLQVAQFASRRGDRLKAEQIFLELLSALARIHSADSEPTNVARMELAFVYEQREDFVQAEKWYSLAWESRHRVLGDDHYLTRSAAFCVGAALMGQGDLEKAEAQTRELAGRLLASEISYQPNDAGRIIDLLVDVYDKMHEARPNDRFDRKAEAWRGVKEQWSSNPLHPPPVPTFEDDEPASTRTTSPTDVPLTERDQLGR